MTCHIRATNHNFLHHLLIAIRVQWRFHTFFLAEYTDWLEVKKLNELKSYLSTIFIINNENMTINAKVVHSRRR